jgi:hypothetical protein
MDFLNFRHLFDNGNKEEPAQKTASQILNMHRVLPDLKYVMDHVDQLDLKPIEGVAVVVRATGKIPSNAYGSCIYYTEEEANKTLDLWRKADDTYEDTYCHTPVNADETYELKKVRVSLEKGIEFLK